MTEWLIHFTKRNGLKSAREVLRQILIEGVLKPTFSLRKGRKTVYGPTPAVCFTEQPLRAFVTYLDARGDDASIDGYGLLVHKLDIYSLGGLPVVYGLRSSVEPKDGEPGYVAHRRMIRESDMPFHEQYRFVSFAPHNYPYPYDWSHEREWRWSSSESRDKHTGFLYLGLPIGGERGMNYHRIHAFVKEDKDVPWLQSELRKAVSQALVGNITFQGEPYVDYWRRVLPHIEVISIETVRRELAAGHREYAKFETHPANGKAKLL